MYRFKTDKRVMHSAGLLFDAVVELMSEKHFDNIGIKEVSEQAGVGRATFYRNFDYVDDILRFQLDNLFAVFQEIHTEREDRSAGPEEVRALLTYWTTKSSILKTLVQADRWQLFQQRFDFASEYRLIEVAAEMGLSSSEIRYLQAIVNSQISSVLKTWIEGGCVESAEQLGDLMELPYKIYQQRQLILTPEL